MAVNKITVGVNGNLGYLLGISYKPKYRTQWMNSGSPAWIDYFDWNNNVFTKTLPIQSKDKSSVSLFVLFVISAAGCGGCEWPLTVFTQQTAEAAGLQISVG